MSDGNWAALKGIKALTFDVFGTVVDWRTTVQDALEDALVTKLTAPDFALLPHDLQQRARALVATDLSSSASPPFAPTFAQQWRDAYVRFCLGFRCGETPWKDVDAHHHDSLVALLDDVWGLRGLFTAAEVRALSLVWHRLAPWADAPRGLAALRLVGRDTGLVTATLSNGNRSLLADLDALGRLRFDRLLSAEDFGCYKPDARVYLGAAEVLGLRPGEVAMVAAHLGDLAAARACGLRTVYVERRGEEAWAVGEERYQAARAWVDLWVGWEEDGFVEVARRLGEVLEA